MKNQIQQQTGMKMVDTKQQKVKKTKQKKTIEETEEERKRRRSGKPNTKKACYHCKKSHSCCSNEKPCPRCVQRGLICMTEEEYKEAQLVKLEKQKQQEDQSMVLSKSRINQQQGPLSLIDLMKSKAEYTQYPIQGTNQNVFGTMQHIPGFQQQQQQQPFMSQLGGGNDIMINRMRKNYESNLLDSRPISIKKINNNDHVHKFTTNNLSGIPAEATSSDPTQIMIQNLTDVMTQQKRIISHLLSENSSSSFTNPFSEYFLTPVPVSMWKFNGIGRPRELLSCNDAFAGLLHCSSFRELVSDSYQHEGIHIVLANCNVDPTNTPMSDLLTLSQGIAIILHGILRHIQIHPQFDILDKVLFMTNKSRIYGKVLFNRIFFKNGVMYMSHHEIDKWDNEISINNVKYPATIFADEGYLVENQETVYDVYHSFLSNFQKYMESHLKLKLGEDEQQS
mmetsp:Transcript_4359/g.6417  ORF Transcript_4359/g.6417 Transcript_4359/m.6417 type:complete len:451 (+) Transcript_4359:77-1429(+)